MKNKDNIDDNSIKKEIEENYDAIATLKKLMPLGIMTMVGFSFILLLIPGRGSQTTFADFIGYPYSVLVCLICSGLIYFYSLKKAVKNRKNNIMKLEMKLRDDK